MSSTLCYNRGCGKQYNPRNNPDNSCQYHPGAPYFHDAYKGWTCCGKKCTDFTEFLNTPGCSQGQHSNVKPEEPESITGKVGDVDIDEPEPQTPAPLEARIRLERPDPFKTPLTRLKPTVAAALAQAAKSLETTVQTNEASTGEIEIGEPCKNGACKETYQGEVSKPNECVHHPGVPIFHEGLKFWSCCQRKTTDFQSFLNQAGCNFGTHKWKKTSEGTNEVECRHDWHQTATHVVVAIYGKKYDPDSSYVDVNPVRLKCHIVFPEQGGSFDMDIELRGISVGETTASFLGTKVEIKMKKAEPGSWAKLDIPKPVVEKKPVIQEEQKVTDITDEVDDLDLDDLDVTPSKMTLSKEASGGRTDQEIV